MKKPNPTRRQTSPAQAMVEFALVLPILLLLIYGLIEVGRALFIYNNVVSAARQASRYGAAAGLNQSEKVPLYQDCAGMRAAAQRFDFFNNFQDEDILIWHDDGEGKNQVAYCKPNMKTDKSFQPSGGNSSRVRIQISAEYAPILPFIPFEPISISSVSARTILIGVPIEIGDETKQAYEIEPAAGIATATLPAAPPVAGGGGSESKSACDVRHSLLGVAPFGITIYNYSARLTIHIEDIQIWGPPTPSNQTLNRLTLGGAAIWSGNFPNDSPAYFNEFIGDISILPHANKFLQVSFSNNYKADGSEKIVIAFVENACPVLDSSDAGQLP